MKQRPIESTPIPDCRISSQKSAGLNIAWRHHRTTCSAEIRKPVIQHTYACNTDRCGKVLSGHNANWSLVFQCALSDPVAEEVDLFVVQTLLALFRHAFSLAGAAFHQHVQDAVTAVTRDDNRSINGAFDHTIIRIQL